MESSVLKIENFAASFGEHTILKDINLSFSRNTLTAIMGPSGCGKTTLIRCINRMHELVPNARVSGKILLDNEDIYNIDPIIVRRQIGMVFQRPNPFPTMSIYDNVIAGYNLNGINLRKEEMDQTVEESLRKAALWEDSSRGSVLPGLWRCIRRFFSSTSPPPLWTLNPRPISKNWFPS
jgi:phosphate transport system ATP-binding protein